MAPSIAQAGTRKMRATSRVDSSRCCKNWESSAEKPIGVNFTSPRQHRDLVHVLDAAVAGVPALCEALRAARTPLAFGAVRIPDGLEPFGRTALDDSRRLS